MIRPGTPERFMMRSTRVGVLAIVLDYFRIHKKVDGWEEVGFLAFWKHVVLWRRKRDK
jgi:hypothetical protein